MKHLRRRNGRLSFIAPHAREGIVARPAGATGQTMKWRMEQQSAEADQYFWLASFCLFTRTTPPRCRRGWSAALRGRKSDNWRIASRGRWGGSKGKPTAVIQTEDIKSIAIELERFIITSPPLPPKKDYCDKKID